MPRPVSTSTLTALVAAAALRSAPASADGAGPSAARLDFRREPGAERCISADALVNAVNTRWRRRVLSATSGGDILVRGSAGRASSSSWVVRIELLRADGTSLGSRELVTGAADCSALDDSLALAIGLMLDVSEKRLLEEHGSVPAAPASPRIAIPAETLAPRAPLHLEAAVAPAVGLGTLPGAALAARGELSVDPPRLFRVSLALSGWTARDATDAGRGAHFSLWTADLGVCPVAAPTGAVVAHLCVVQRVGEIKATGRGLTDPATTNAVFYEVGLRAAVRWAFAPPIGLVAGADLGAPLLRYRFAYRDVTGEAAGVYRMAPVNGGLDVGLSLRW